MHSRIQNSPRSQRDSAQAKIRPDEKEEAASSARMRGSWKKLSSKRKAKKHSRRR